MGVGIMGAISGCRCGAAVACGAPCGAVVVGVVGVCVVGAATLGVVVDGGCACRVVGGGRVGDVGRVLHVCGLVLLQ